MNQGEALGRWTGAHLETYSASLNVRGAEESPDFEEFDQCFDGPFLKCLAKLKEYQIQINENRLDAYLSLQGHRQSQYYEGGLDRILGDLLDDGFITREEYNKYIV